MSKKRTRSNKIQLKAAAGGFVNAYSVMHCSRVVGIYYRSGRFSHEPYSFYPICILFKLFPKDDGHYKNKLVTACSRMFTRPIKITRCKWLNPLLLFPGEAV